MPYVHRDCLSELAETVRRLRLLTRMVKYLITDFELLKAFNEELDKELISRGLKVEEE